ncbi:hypothetical protein [Aquimarina gracilis]
MDTTIYVFNENGFIKSSELEKFCSIFFSKTTFRFNQFDKTDIDIDSTIFKKFSSQDLEFTIYDYGYVMRIDGSIKKSMILLEEIDNIIDNDVEYHISPTQRIQNSIENKYPRGADRQKLAQFLDIRFNNNDYSNSLLDGLI